MLRHGARSKARAPVPSRRGARKPANKRYGSEGHRRMRAAQSRLRRQLLTVRSAGGRPVARAVAVAHRPAQQEPPRRSAAAHEPSADLQGGWIARPESACSRAGTVGSPGQRALPARRLHRRHRPPASDCLPSCTPVAWIAGTRWEMRQQRPGSARATPVSGVQVWRTREAVASPDYRLESWARALHAAGASLAVTERWVALPCRTGMRWRGALCSHVPGAGWRVPVAEGLPLPPSDRSASSRPICSRHDATRARAGAAGPWPVVRHVTRRGRKRAQAVLPCVCRGGARARASAYGDHPWPVQRVVLQTTGGDGPMVRGGFDHMCCSCLFGKHEQLTF